MYRAVRDLKIVRSTLLLLPISYVLVIARLSIRDNATSVENQTDPTLSFRSTITFYINFGTFLWCFRDKIYMCQEVVTSEMRQTMYFGSLCNSFTYCEKEVNAM